ncbi:hypothetical protein L9F63_007265, partial [Diploptera punctata]
NKHFFFFLKQCSGIFMVFSLSKRILQYFDAIKAKLKDKCQDQPPRDIIKNKDKDGHLLIILGTAAGLSAVPSGGPSGPVASTWNQIRDQMVRHF